MWSFQNKKEGGSVCILLERWLMCIGFVIYGNIILGHGYLLMEFVTN